MPPDVRYIFRYRDGAEECVDIHHDASGTLIVPPTFEPPDWTALECEQCSHCPLNPRENPRCPVAVNIALVCADRPLGQSHTPVSLRVVTPQREYRTETTVQRAMSALLGLAGALSSCPYTRPLRAMALSHLPVATERESLVRMTSLHLLGQYIRQQQDPSVAVSLDDLPQVYKDLATLNHGMARRLRHVKGTDAALNAIVLLDILSRDMRIELDQALPRLGEYLGMTPAGQD